MANKPVSISYDYSDAPTILEFAQCDKRIRGIMGPFGSGKSSGMVAECIRRAFEQEPMEDGVRRVRVAVIRNTYRQLEDTTMKTVFDWLPPNYFGRHYKSEHRYVVTAFKNVEIEFLFRALDRPEHVSNLLSLELTFAWVNEAREVPFALIKPLLGRTNRYPSRRDSVGATWSGIFMDTNPPSPRSWWYKLFEIDKKANCAIFKQPSGLSEKAENRRFLAPTYYEDLIDLYDEDEKRAYVDGEYSFIKDGKPVYPGYRSSIHGRTGLQAIHGIPIIRGWDFGLTPALLLAQVAPTGQLRFLREYTTKRAGLDAFSELALRDVDLVYPGYSFEDWGDPAGVSGQDNDDRSCFDLLEGKGIDIQASTNNLRTRLESMRKGLDTLIDGEPAVVVDTANCPTLAEGFQGGYKYKKLLDAAGTDRYQPEPLKDEYSHPHDAAQYIAIRVFGDYVMGLSSHVSELPASVESAGARGYRPESDPWNKIDYTNLQESQDCDFDPFDYN